MKARPGSGRSLVIRHSDAQFHAALELATHKESFPSFRELFDEAGGNGAIRLPGQCLSCKGAG